MHKIIGAPIIEQLPLPLSSSRLLQKQSHSSRHGIRPIPRWRSSTSSPSLPVIPIEQPGSKEYFFRQNRRTPVARVPRNVRRAVRVYQRGEESIDPLARRPKEYLSGCWFAAIYEPCTATLTSTAINLSTPSRFRPSVHASYTLLRYSMVLAATDVWIKAWLGGEGGLV